MHPGGFRAPQQRADVLWVLERVEDEDERRLVAFSGPGEDVGQRREPTRLNDEGDALMAIKSGEGRQRPSLDLDDRDAQPGRMEDELLEGVPSLRDDEEAIGGATGGEDLLDRTAAGDELLVRAKEVGRGQGSLGTRPRGGLEPRPRPGAWRRGWAIAVGGPPRRPSRWRAATRRRAATKRRSVAPVRRAAAKWQAVVPEVRSVATVRRSVATVAVRVDGSPRPRGRRARPMLIGPAASERLRWSGTRAARRTATARVLRRSPRTAVGSWAVGPGPAARPVARSWPVRDPGIVRTRRRSRAARRRAGMRTGARRATPGRSAAGRIRPARLASATRRGVPALVVVATRSVSHHAPPRRDASAGRRGCPPR